jgi:T5SS/PEP-CTERM-associated repeat protein
MPVTTFTWTATASNAWTVGTNWKPDGPPTAADTAFVPSGSIQINTGTVAITDLSLGGSLSGPTSGEGAISVVTGGALLVSDAMALWAGSTLSVDAASFVDIGTSDSASAGSILVEANNTLLGDGTVVGSLVNNGTIEATNTGTLASSTGGELTIQGAISGTGTMNIEAGATLLLDGTIAAGETINFATGGAPETLILANQGSIISPVINGFADGDRIEFSNSDEIVTIVAGPSLTNGNTITFGVTTAGGVDINYVLTDVNFAAGAPTTFFDSFDPVTNDAFFTPGRYLGWTGETSTDLGTASNWYDITDGQDPSLIVPGPGDYAEFYNGAGGTLSGPLSAQIIYFFDGANYTLASGGTMSEQLLFGIGATSGSQSLTLDGGSTVSADGYIYIGEYAGANGTLAVNGGGVFQYTAPPDTTRYSMLLGTASGATGAVVVNGTGALVNLGLNGVEIGDGGGSGTVIVSQGGTFIAGTENSVANNSMAIGRTGNGTVIVTDPGSMLQAVGEVYIDHTGTGQVIVENSATFVASVDPTGLAGLQIGWGTSAGVGGLGMVTVTTNGVLADQGYAVVGESGTPGELNVSDGGTVEVGTSLVVGDTGTISGTIYLGSGTVTVAGTGALLTVASAVQIGPSGQGVLDVLNNGNVQITNASTGNLDLGGDETGPQGGTGTVAVSTGGSIEVDAGLFVWTGSTLSVDANSGVDVGTNGAFIAGAVNVEIGHFIFGDGMIDAAVVDAGDITATNDGTVGAGTTLEITGAVSGAGTLAFASSDVALQLDSAPGSGQAVTFDPSLSDDTLVLNSPSIATTDDASTFVALDNIAPGDRIDFGDGVLINGVTKTAIGGGAYDVTVTVTQGATAGVITFDNVTFGAGAISFQHGTDTNGDASIEATLCFCAGTAIATPHGEVPVERLAVGDLVLTADGGSKPITWIGMGRVLAARGRRTAATPVIVRRGALADNVPHRDLYITKGHALYLDSVLIPVEFLANHRSILWDDRAQEVTIYHIELATHAVLLANGAPAESYRDDGNRRLFHNANTGWGNPEKPPCAPVLTGGPLVDAAWRRLLDRAGPRPGLPLTDEPDLHLLVDGQRVDGSPRPNGYYAFELARPPSDLRVISRAGSPAELGLARDPRVLGVAVRQIRLWQGARLRTLDASDRSLVDGFHAFESVNSFRWTNGDAALPAVLFWDIEGACQVELLLGDAMRYPLFAETDRRAA